MVPGNFFSKSAVSVGFLVLATKNFTLVTFAWSSVTNRLTLSTSVRAWNQTTPYLAALFFPVFNSTAQ